VSSYTLYPPKTFRASQVKVERLTLVRRRGLMTAFEFDSNQTLGYDVICRWLEPNAVDPTPEFRWQAASEDGI